MSYRHLILRSYLKSLPKYHSDQRLNESTTGKRALRPITYWDIPIIGQYLDGAKGTVKKVNEHCLHAIEELEKSAKAVCGNESEKAKKSQSFLAKMFVLNTVSEATLITERNDWKYVDLDHC